MPSRSTSSRIIGSVIGSPRSAASTRRPRGLLAPWCVSVALSTAAVVIALIFVSAPFYVCQAQAAFAAVDRSWLDASRTLGAWSNAVAPVVTIGEAAAGPADDRSFDPLQRIDERGADATGVWHA